jgi:hypothetical protein
MGLLDMLNKGGGLFDPIAQSSERGFDLQKMMANTEPMNAPQFAPPEERQQSRGGVFGSGYNGEDIMSMLLRAAAIAQGDLGAGAQFGANIGAKARAEAEAASAERQWRERKQWEWDNSPKDAPSPYRWKNNEGDLMETGPDGAPRLVYDDPTRKPEYRVGPDGKFYAIDIATPPAAPIGKLTPIEGGGTGNGAGGFRR